MLFNQIGTCSVLLGIPNRLGGIGLLIVVGIFDLLLEMKLLKDLKVNETGVKLIPTTSLMLESKSCTRDNFLGSKGNIDAQITGSILHPTRLTNC